METAILIVIPRCVISLLLEQEQAKPTELVELPAQQDDGLNVAATQRRSSVQRSCRQHRISLSSCCKNRRQLSSVARRERRLETPGPLAVVEKDWVRLYDEDLFLLTEVFSSLRLICRICTRRAHACHGLLEERGNPSGRVECAAAQFRVAQTWASLSNTQLNSDTLIWNDPASSS